MSDNPDADTTFTCMEAGYRVGKDILCQDFNGEVNFSRGKLASLKLVLPYDWQESLPSMVAKFGRPSAGDRDKTFGTWKSGNFYMVATQVEGGTAIYWMTPEKYKWSAARAVSANDQTSTVVPADW